MKTLVVLLLALLPLQSQAFFWDRPEFREADNLADLTNESVKERRSEKYKIVEFELYRSVLSLYDTATLVEGKEAEIEFAQLKRSPMYAYTANESRSILAPMPAEFYLKFSDDFTRLCVRRNYAGIINTPLPTRCLSLRPDSLAAE